MDSGMNENRQHATLDSLIDNQLSESTRICYNSKLNQVVEWVKGQSRYELLKDDGSLDLNNFQYSDFMDFAVWKYKHSKCRVDTISGYRSAMRYYFEREGPSPSILQLSMDKLFPGAAQKDRFGKQLAKLLSHPDPTCGRSEYGTHSIRKGAATFACSGSTGGPSIVSVCLRCGWSLGNVLERYMHYEGAGDQFLGRVMAGLPINDASFAILPPHFKMPFDSDVSSAINKVFPSLSRALEMLIPKSHPIFYSRVFTDVDMVPMLKARLVTHDSVLPATGIPPHVGLHKELTRATTEMRSIPNEVIRGVDALLETKGVAAGNLTQRLLKETLVEVVAPMVQALASSAEVSPAPAAPPCIVNYPIFEWNPWQQRLLDNFITPSVDVATAWQLWWCGNAGMRMPPFRLIKAGHIPRSQVKPFSEWRFAMDFLYRVYTAETGIRIPENPTPAHATDTYAIILVKIKLLLQKTPKGRIRRGDQIKIATFASILRKVPQLGLRM
ncbi:hypothetical protein DYB30_012729 [Aphanomyces astaci]|uniref:Core-binding (CB) domain-containing protein n=1 Tax=Aphanomyces astaci TaxID=112090 RepID=A0A397CHA5_APHAT|nr:hypothetical protein DYB30_012729 [Aphanomyces astaci]